MNFEGFVDLFDPPHHQHTHYYQPHDITHGQSYAPPNPNLSPSVNLITYIEGMSEIFLKALLSGRFNAPRFVFLIKQKILNNPAWMQRHCRTIWFSKNDFRKNTYERPSLPWYLYHCFLDFWMLRSWVKKNDLKSMDLINQNTFKTVDDYVVMLCNCPDMLYTTLPKCAHSINDMEGAFSRVMILIQAWGLINPVTVGGKNAHSNAEIEQGIISLINQRTQEQLIAWLTEAPNALLIERIRVNMMIALSMINMDVSTLIDDLPMVNHAISILLCNKKLTLEIMESLVNDTESVLGVEHQIKMVLNLPECDYMYPYESLKLGLRLARQLTTHGCFSNGHLSIIKLTLASISEDLFELASRISSSKRGNDEDGTTDQKSKRGRKKK